MTARHECSPRPTQWDAGSCSRPQVRRLVWRDATNADVALHALESKEVLGTQGLRPGRRIHGCWPLSRVWPMLLRQLGAGPSCRVLRVPRAEWATGDRLAERRLTRRLHALAITLADRCAAILTRSSPCGSKMQKDGYRRRRKRRADGRAARAMVSAAPSTRDSAALPHLTAITEMLKPVAGRGLIYSTFPQHGLDPRRYAAQLRPGSCAAELAMVRWSDLGMPHRRSELGTGAATASKVVDRS